MDSPGYAVLWRRVTPVIFAMLCCMALAAAHAHTGATGIVKERMDLMKDIKSEMKTLGDMLRGKRAYEPARAGKAAEALQAHASRMPSLFPEGSLDHPTEATPAIWKDWPGFEKSAKDMADYAANLKALTANDTAETRAAFKRVAGTCSSCHQNFRKK